MGVDFIVVEGWAWEGGAVVGGEGSDGLEEMLLIVEEFVDEFGLGVDYIDELFGDLMVDLLIWLHGSKVGENEKVELE